MNTTTVTTTGLAQIDSDTTASRTRRSLWTVGAAAGLVAAAATTAVVAVARALDQRVAVDGKEIPLGGFAQLTLFGTLIGVLLATVISRRAARPRRTFVVTTVALTIASLLPDIAVDATIGSKLVLMSTHLAAAAIVVPVLAGRLER